MEKAAIFDNLLKKIYYYLSIRPRTKKEVLDYLEKRLDKLNLEGSGEDKQEIINKITSKLEEQRYINDADFVRWFVESRSNIRPKGKRVLYFELKQKGVDKEVVDKFFLNVMIDEFELAKKALSKKWFLFKKLDREKKYQRALRHLLGKGFSFEVAKKAFEEMNNVE